MNKINLGTGVLTWGRAERLSDRYGAIYLIADGLNSFAQCAAPSLVNAEVADRHIGLRGELIAVVKDARKSTHIGDLSRGTYPSKPENGEIIVLGRGRFFTEPAPEGGTQIGVSPDPSDGISEDDQAWLDVPKLYRAHEQLVDLFFHPETRR